MAKQKISELPNATTLDGTEEAIVNQNNVTSKTTVLDLQQIALDAANTAQTTADAKLATVAVDGTTITGDGTVGNPLVANVGSAVKEYRGYLTISGAGVAFTSKQNDVGDIAWVVYSNGQLRGTLAGAFLSAKFFGLVGNLNGGSVPYINIVRRFNDDTVIIDLFKYDGSQTGTPNGAFAIHLIINN